MIGIIRIELSFLWILSMCKFRRITHILHIKPFGLLRSLLAGVYTSIKSTKNKIHSYNNVTQLCDSTWYPRQYLNTNKISGLYNGYFM